ncbi:unnamed protein product [Blepharisma stoltei]|uniref:RING-type domain-containing protein n=1 Tax=Blepharisma stoltei TaxID=1481888 RepID=A0AAU9JD81_9CILI|nr:unnamed protein product [Blepharisma stoltei]
MNIKESRKHLLSQLLDMGYPQPKAVQAANKYTDINDAILYLTSEEPQDSKASSHKGSLKIPKDANDHERSHSSKAAHDIDENKEQLERTMRKSASQLAAMNSKSIKKAAKATRKEIRKKFRSVYAEIKKNLDILSKTKKELRKKIKKLKEEGHEKTARKTKRKLSNVKDKIGNLDTKVDDLYLLNGEFTEMKKSNPKDITEEYFFGLLEDIENNVWFDEELNSIINDCGIFEARRVETSFENTDIKIIYEIETEEDETEKIAVEQAVPEIPQDSPHRHKSKINPLSETRSIIQQKIQGLGLSQEYAHILNMHQTFEESYLGLIQVISKRRMKNHPNQLSICRSREIGTKTIFLQKPKQVLSPYQSIQRLDPFKPNQGLFSKLFASINPKTGFIATIQGKKSVEEIKEDPTEILSPDIEENLSDFDEYEEVPDDIDEGDVSRHSPTNEGIIDILIEAYRAKGVSVEAIDSLPYYTLENEEALPYTTCIICLEEFIRGDILMVMTCEHFYHSSCLKKWLQGSKKCPLCNADVQ